MRKEKVLIKMSDKKEIEIKVLEKLNCEITAPASKAYTLRALFIAGLAKGKSILKNPLFGDDQKYAIDALRELGVKIDIKSDIRDDKSVIVVEGVDGNLKSSGNDIFIGNSGVSARILAVLCSLADKDIVIDGDPRMREGRPIQDLLDAVNHLGIDAESVKGNGCLPLKIKRGSFKGGVASLKGDKSSQYFSSILLSAPYSKDGVVLKTDGKLYSKPYIDITIDIMKEFGVDTGNDDYKEFKVDAGKGYEGKEYLIEGDFSGASFFFAAAAIMQGRIKINNLSYDSKQGDKKFVDFLEMMGCEVKHGKGFVEVIGKPLKGIKVDMKDYPDIVIPLAVAAGFADGKSEFYNISHLKYKECDRLKAPVKELNKMGVKAECTDDSLVVDGNGGEGVKGCLIETYKDHRMVMGFAVAGLKVPGVVIKNPENCKKSFPDFFDVLESLRGDL